MKLVPASMTLVLLTMATFCGIEERPNEKNAEENSVKGFWYRVANLRFSCLRFLILFADSNTPFNITVKRCPFLPDRFVPLTDDSVFFNIPDAQDLNYPGQKSSYKPDSLIRVVGDPLFVPTFRELFGSYWDHLQSSYRLNQNYEDGKRCYPIQVEESDFYSECFFLLMLVYITWFVEDPEDHPWTSQRFWEILVLRFFTAYYMFVISTVLLCVLLN